MKKMTRIIRSFYIKSICLSVLACLSFFPVYAGNDTTHAEHSGKFITDTGKWIFYSRDNKLQMLDEGKNYFIVLKNERSCPDCFRILNNYIGHVKDSLNAVYLLISLIDSSSLDRRRNYFTDRCLVSDFNDVWFQYKCSKSETLFGKMKTNNTPEVLIIHNDILKNIPYNEIFDFPSMNISLQTQFRIFEYLK